MIEPLLKQPLNIPDLIWVRSTFTLHRNLENQHFPAKMEKGEFEKTSHHLLDVLKAQASFQNPQSCEIKELPPLDKELIFEHFFCLEGFPDPFLGQAVVLEETGSLLGLINIQDHLQLHLVDTSGQWEKAWGNLSNLETLLGKELRFAFSPKFGYLTADKALAGTGLVVHVYLHLPALVQTGKISEMTKDLEEGVSLLGLQGSLENVVGDLIIVKNTYTLGYSEDNVLYTLHSMAMRLIALEKQVRSLLTGSSQIDIKDRVSRAYGLLLHSYQLQTKEALQALSLVKLGVALGFVEGISEEKLTELMFQSRKAQLLHTLKALSLSPEETAHKRAEFLHTYVHNLKLKI